MPFVEHMMGLGTPAGQALSTAGGGATGLVAVGTTATDALLLSASWNVITTSSASTGVKAPNVTAGFGGVVNSSGQTIKFYPPTGVTITTAAAANAASADILNGKVFFFFWTSSTTMGGGALA